MSKERNREAFEMGKEDAKNAGVLDQIAHNLSKSIPSGEDGKAYDAGWEEGMKEKNK